MSVGLYVILVFVIGYTWGGPSEQVQDKAVSEILDIRLLCLWSQVINVMYLDGPSNNIFHQTFCLFLLYTKHWQHYIRRYNFLKANFILRNSTIQIFCHMLHIIRGKKLLPNSFILRYASIYSWIKCVRNFKNYALIYQDL